MLCKRTGGRDEFQLGRLCQERLWGEAALEPGLEELGVF